MTNKLKISRPLTPAGRRVRSASLPFSGQYAADARAQLGDLRDRLDAIAADERMTPTEKSAAAARVLTEKREWHLRMLAQAERDLATVVDVARRTEAATRGIENNLTRYDEQRLKLTADALRSLPAGDRAQDFERAFARRDLPRLLAHGLNDVLGDSGRRAVAVLVAQADFQALTEDAGGAVSQLLAMREVGRGLNELSERQDPHEPVEVRGPELLRFANEGIRSIIDAETIEGALPADVAPWLRSMILPKRTVTAAEQPVPAETSPATAGGAA